MKHSFIEMPMCFESQMIVDQNKYLRDALNDNKIYVDVSYNTTKSLYVKLRYKLMATGINQEVKGFKTKYEKGYSYITGNEQHAYYFKLLKSQGMQELKSYVETIIKNIYQNYRLPEDFQVIWYKTNVIKQI